MLPQPIQIFRKDLMHLWPETLVVLALFGAFCFAAPSGWSGSDFAAYVPYLAGFLKLFLMPVSWLVVICRLIQDEPLVGDRQFWTSRPYHWASLFAAKVLYLLVFLYLPFFLMQVYLLKHAGLHPMVVLPALLHNLLLLTVIIVIPFMAISAVTSTFARMLLSVVGVVVALLVLVSVVGYFTFLNMTPPHLDWLADAIFILLPVIALLYQYRTRKTGIARLLLIATPIFAILVFILAPTTSMIAHSYPEITGASAPKLGTFGPEAQPPTRTGNLALLRKHVLLALPIKVEGIDEKNDYHVEGDRVTITAGSFHYTSSYNSALLFGTNLTGGSPVSFIPFYLPLDVFNQVRNTPADVHLQLAVQHIAAQDPATWKATAQPFSVPGNGLCSFPAEDAASQNPTCRYPFAAPDISFVSAKLSPGGCPAGNTPSPGGTVGRASLGGTTSNLLEFDPVVTVPLNFQGADPRSQQALTLCPGTDLSFIEGKTLDKGTLVVDAKALTLDPYANRRAPRNAQPQPGTQPGAQQGPPSSSPE